MKLTSNDVENKVLDLIKNTKKELIKDLKVFNVPVMHFASMIGSLKIMRLLVKYHADVNNKLQKVKSALRGGNLVDYIKQNDMELVQKYVQDDKNKASLRSMFKKQSTPLHTAVIRRYTSIVSYLLKNGADPNIKDVDGDSPAFVATDKAIHTIYKEYFDIMDALLEAGADVDATNDKGDTLLHLASRHRKPSIVEYLLRKHANVTIRNLEKESALDIARSRHYPELIGLLEKSDTPNENATYFYSAKSPKSFNDSFYSAKSLFASSPKSRSKKQIKSINK